MAVKSGRNGSLKIIVGTTVGGAAGSPVTALGSLRSWSIDSTANTQTVDSASMGNLATWTETYTLSKSWSASFAGLWDSSDELADTLQVGMNAAIILYPDFSGTVGITYSGTGVIDNLTVGASYDGMIEVNFSLSGVGALTAVLD
jgi:predicted secreted protein